VFTREEAVAIVAFLEYNRDTDSSGLTTEEINGALNSFWRDQAANAPTHHAVRQHLKQEAEYLSDIGRRKNE
jgi:hypothetical protein